MKTERRATPRPPAPPRPPDESGASRHFAQTYAEARDKFFGAARARGHLVEIHEHPLTALDVEIV
jgi:hypothetical protein